MKKPKSIETLILAEELIQHIQSFMSAKEAARSAILSKSWFNAWLTRPTIDLDDRDLGHDVFEEFAKRTMQRYQDLNRKIESFRLRSYGSRRRDVAPELIANAIKIGATHLQLEMDCSFTLPQEVLRSETLLKLSLNICLVYGNCVVSCSSLKSLTTTNVNFYGGVFMDIISCCISIEELSLSNSYGLGLGQSIELHKLRRLSLSSVDVDALFFTNFASRFPCLKDLTLHDCGGCCTKIHIASTSLQTISFKPRIKSQRAKFDVPNIRKFTLSFCSLPSHLSINGASSWEWDLDISISCYNLYESSWFMNLKKLLNKFRLSRISLFIERQGTDSDYAVDVKVQPKPLVVENLTITAPPTFCCAFLLRLFGAFRPKFLTLCDRHNSYRRMLHKVKDNDNFRRRLIETLFVSNWQEKFGQFGLKKVKVEIRKEFDTEWRPLQLNKALTASKAKRCMGASWEWELDISMYCNCFHKTSWFLKLKKLTKGLSRISLSLILKF